MSRTWARDRDWESKPEWASRVYRSSDGWTAERYYSPGDRYLNRPEVGWSLKRTAHLIGWGEFFFAKLADVKEFVDTGLAIAYIDRTDGRLSSADYQEIVATHRREYPRRLHG